MEMFLGIAVNHYTPALRQVVKAVLSSDDVGFNGKLVTILGVGLGFAFGVSSALVVR